MMSNGKQFTITCEMLTAVAHDPRWPDVVTGISAHFPKFAFVLFCYITNHLMTVPLGNSEFCFPLDQSLSVKYYTVTLEHTDVRGSITFSKGGVMYQAGRDLPCAFDSGVHVVTGIKVCRVKSGGLNVLLIQGTLHWRRG